jgi:hypothetical protein
MPDRHSDREARVAQGLPSVDDPISTDRPAVAASSTVVPIGSLQIENGFLLSNPHSFDGPETAIRFGLTGNTELRFSAPDDYFNSTLNSGFGDTSIGMKQQLGPAGRFDVSLIVFLSLPSGANAVSSHGYDPGLQLPWSRKLSHNWSAGGQLAVYWPTQGDHRNLTGESTFLLDRQLTKPMDAFVEYAGDFPTSRFPGQHCASRALHIGHHRILGESFVCGPKKPSLLPLQVSWGRAIQ